MERAGCHILQHSIPFTKKLGMLSDMTCTTPVSDDGILKKLPIVPGQSDNSQVSCQVPEQNNSCRSELDLSLNVIRNLNFFYFGCLAEFLQTFIPGESFHVPLNLNSPFLAFQDHTCLFAPSGWPKKMVH